MDFVRIGNVVLHHAVSGPEGAPAIVLVNALGSDFRIWSTVAPHLATRHRVIVCDKRGHGLSDCPPGPWSIDDHVDDLLGLLDHLGVRRVLAVGLSVGGLVVQRLYQRAPQRVAGLVLACTAARIGTEEVWNARIAEVEAGGVAPLVANVLTRWFSPAFRARHPDAVAGWGNMVARTPAAGYAATCAALRDADYRAAAAEIAVPVLCIAGDQDGSTPAEVVAATAALIPGARLEILAGAAHMAGIEQGPHVAGLIAAHAVACNHAGGWGDAI